MKKLVLGLALLSGVLSISAQQEPHNNHHHKEGMCQCKKMHKKPSPEEKMAKMKQELNLSDAQVKKIKELHEKKKVEHEKAMKKNREAAEKKRNAYKKQMKAILTAEQYKKWEESKPKGRNHGERKK